MSLSDALFDALQALVAGRCYRLRLPQPYTLPALTISRIDTTFEYAHNGNQSLTHGRWQVSCWASTNKAAETLAGQVQTAIDGWIIAGTRHALPANQYDMTDPETGVHQMIIDLIVWWKT